MRTGIPRPIEFILAAIGLIIASPLLLFSALAVSLTSRGTILFRQERVGKNGAPFVLYKFRTMRPAEKGLQITSHDDSRITRVGRWLRNLKLDELPELWNILRGEMSFVGPRPEVPRFVDLSNPMWREVLSIRPGLTDPVTILLRDEEGLLGRVEGDREEYYRQVLQPWKLSGYIKYFRQRTMWSDVWVILDTILVILVPNGQSPPVIGPP